MHLTFPCLSIGRYVQVCKLKLLIEQSKWLSTLFEYIYGNKYIYQFSTYFTCMKTWHQKFFISFFILIQSVLVLAIILQNMQHLNFTFWLRHGPFLVASWFFDGCVMVFSRLSHGCFMILWWLRHDFFAATLWLLYGCVMVAPWLRHDCFLVIS